MKSQRIAIATLVLLLVCGAGLGVFWIVVSSPDGNSPELEVASDSKATTPPETPDSTPRHSTPEPETRKGSGSAETHDATTRAPAPETANSNPTINRTLENRPVRATSMRERRRDETRSLPGDSAAEQPPEEFRVTISGQVVDGAGQGIGNAQVHGEYTPSGFDLDASGARARHLARRATGSLGVVATTDSAGYFQAVIAPKTSQAATSIDVTLTAACSGYVPDGKTTVKGLGKDDSRDGITIKLTQGGSVTGKVVDMAGRAVAGVFIHATPAGGERGTPFGLTFDPRTQAKSDVSGIYRFDALKDGQWTLRVNSGGHQQVSGPGQVTVEASREITAADFVVTLRTTVKIRVLDESGAPVNGSPRALRVSAVVTYGGGKTRRVASTVGENGEAAFIGIPDDATQMTIEVSGYKISDSVPLSITPNQENNAGDVRLSPIDKAD